MLHFGVFPMEFFAAMIDFSLFCAIFSAQMSGWSK